MIICGNCKGDHETAAEVRACYEVPASPSQVAGNAVARSDGLAATDKQLGFIERLLAERPSNPINEQWSTIKSSLTRPGASQLIDSLTSQPKEVAVSRGGDIEVTSAVPNGTYTVEMGDDTHVTLRFGNITWGDLKDKGQVVYFLSGSDNDYDYTGFAFVLEGKARVWKKFKSESRIVAALQFLLRDGKVDEAHERFLNMAEAFALQSSKCLRCLHTLTVTQSVVRGLGPVCAAIEGVA